jgi:hypothetical protein
VVDYSGFERLNGGATENRVHSDDLAVTKMVESGAVEEEYQEWSEQKTKLF